MALVLGVHRDTVRRYRDMSEEAMVQWVERPYHNRKKKLSDYAGFVSELLKGAPYLTSPQVLDRLKENFEDLPAVSDKTVYNFVEALRLSLSLPKTKEERRQMAKLPDPDYGHEAQVDWGEKNMLTAAGRFKKVYFFAMVLSRSRQKFVYFQDVPFTSAMTAYAHHLAFRYFGGMPRRVLYDQDAVLIVAENLGDYQLTREMEAFRKSAGYEAVFCRPADPQSKGKVENVVRFVKDNFLKGRKFTTVESLNEQAAGWLERTGNGHRHATTRLVPAEEFEKEREHLLPYHASVEPPAPEGRLYTVRRDNTVSYHGCFYQLPLGCYQGPGTQVWLVETSGTTIEIFHAQTHEPVITHTVSAVKGKHVTKPELNKTDKADPTDAERSIESRLAGVAGAAPLWDTYREMIRSDRPRYYNASVRLLRDLYDQMPDSLVTALLDTLVSNKVLNAYDANDIASAMLVRHSLPPLKKNPSRYGKRGKRPASAPTANLNPQTTDIAAYDRLVDTLSSHKTQTAI
ncbi:MAG: IS21 family transposase [Bacteroidales bacterium]|nr:IS21 family transposase [Bacteroidales bacterium]